MIPVDDYAASPDYYEKLFGAPPSFIASDTEAGRELAGHRAVERRPDRSGNALLTHVVDDLEARLAAVAGPGIEPAKQETYADGARHATFRDPEGNEVSVGGAPPA